MNINVNDLDENFLPSEEDLSDFTDSEMEAGYNPYSDTWEVIVKYNGDVMRLEELMGIEVEILNSRFAIITIQQNLIPQLATYREIEHIEMPSRITFLVQSGLEASCVLPVQNPSRYNLTGKGVIVALIDSGIDYTHTDFRNEDGSTRILYIWDQLGQGRPPAGFKTGVEYSSTEINQALESNDSFQIVPQMDTVGHGTAVAGVAAGNGLGSRNQWNRGIAPDASIIVVRLGYRGWESFSRSTELMRGVKYVLDKAEMLGMPVAINISYGTNNGAHDGNSLFETYLNDMSMQWKNVIVVASGNEASSAHHHSGRVRTNTTENIEFYTTMGLKSFYLTLWKNFTDTFSVELILPNGKSTGEIRAVDKAKTINLVDVDVYVNYGQPNHYTVDQNVFFQVETKTGALPEGVWRLRLRVGDVVDGRYNIWLPITEEVSRSTAFTVPGIYTTLTLPSTALNVTTVGAYNCRQNSITDFSGRGFTRNDVYVKPDLVAPGVNIMTTKNGGGYDTFTGTSIAAPFVTGSAALMMQWGIVQENDPFLYGQRVKAFLRYGTEKKFGVQYPDPSWGYGTLCLNNTMGALEDLKKGWHWI